MCLIDAAAHVSDKEIWQVTHSVRHALNPDVR